MNFFCVCGLALSLAALLCARIVVHHPAAQESRLLGALVGDSDPAESARSLAAARSAVLGIAGDLPPGVRDSWLARPDVAALFEA